MDYNSLSDSDLIALSNKDYASLSDDGLLFLTQNKQPRKTNWTEDIEIGAKQLAHIGKDAWDMSAGALANAFGATDSADNIYKDMELRNATQ